MIAFLLALSMAQDTGKVKKPDEDLRDRWVAEDKFKHAGMSFAITSFAYGGTQNKQAAIAAGVAAGILKETWDKKHKRPFSGRDLIWDMIGVAASYAVIKQARQ